MEQDQELLIDIDWSIVFRMIDFIDLTRWVKELQCCVAGGAEREHLVHQPEMTRLNKKDKLLKRSVTKG